MRTPPTGPQEPLDPTIDEGSRQNIDWGHTFASLAAERPIFHSEADFQHALAWQLHLMMPNARVRLEYPAFPRESKHIDIWLRLDGTTIALELKYKTRRFDASVGDECFALAEHRAHTDNRAKFIEDIQRLKRVVAGLPQSIGYFVLLTNDDRYWKWPSLLVPPGTYALNWWTYATLPAHFRYALIPVTSPNER